MSDTLADQIVKRCEQLEAGRTMWSTHWQDVADVVLPSHAVFTTSQVQGEKRTNRLYDPTAPIALTRFASYVDAMLTPRSQRWHSIKSNNPDLNDIPSVRNYFDQVTDILFSMRYSSKSHFSSKMRENYISLGAFGTSIMYIGEVLGKGSLIYRTLHLSRIFIALNHEGYVDTVYRKFELTTRQAVQEFGLERLPEIITRESEKQPDKLFTFVHAVYPSTDKMRKLLDVKTYPFASVVVSVEGKTVINQSGYRTFPYAVARLDTSPDEDYGRSPAMAVLPEIRMLNAMRKAYIRGLHRQTEPPILAFTDGITGNDRFHLTPNHINYGALDKEGRELIKPFITGDRPQGMMDEINQSREMINDAFMLTLFQVLVDSGQMTAFEVAKRDQEKLELMYSQLDRIQSEQVAVMVDRELDILNAMGVLPPMPPELVEAQGEYELEYENPFARMQKNQEVNSIRETFSFALELAQASPQVMGNFDYDAMLRDAAIIKGVKQKYLLPLKNVLAQREAQQQAQEAATIAQLAPGAAQALKSVREAEAI